MNSKVLKLIIEGPDGAGKSTIAKQLQTQFGGKIVHLSYPKSKDEEENMKQMYIELLTNNENLIIDRAWYSEQVYGPLLRGKSVLTESDVVILEALLNDVGGGIIYCDIDVETGWNRCQARGEHYIKSKEDYEKIHVAYQELFIKRESMRAMQELAPMIIMRTKSK